MSNVSPWTMIRCVALLAVGAGFVTACGGSAELTSGGGGAAGNAVGGASSSAGKGSGGGVSCATVDCAAVDCAPGYRSVLEPDACCPVCEPDGTGGTGGVNGCAGVMCATVACAPGTKNTLRPGECCGVCLPDTQACSDGQDAYRTFRDQLVAQPGATSCTVDSDCKILNGSFQCGDYCQRLPVNATAALVIGQQLDQFGADNCSTCMSAPIPCAAPFPTQCSGGVCTLSNYF